MRGQSVIRTGFPIDSLHGKVQRQIIITQNLLHTVRRQVTGKANERNTLNPVHPPFFPKAGDQMQKAGLLTRSGSDAFPACGGQWQRVSKPYCPLSGAGTHSSGNCSRISRHSLLILIRNRGTEPNATANVRYFNLECRLQAVIYEFPRIIDHYPGKRVKDIFIGGRGTD